MVIELVEYEVTPGSEDAFVEAYRKAAAILKRQKGCGSVRTLRCLEHPNRFRGLVEWETLADHVEGFRGSPDHAELLALLRPFWTTPALVRHYEQIVD